MTLSGEMSAVKHPIFVMENISVLATFLNQVMSGTELIVVQISNCRSFQTNHTGALALILKVSSKKRNEMATFRTLSLFHIQIPRPVYV